MAVDLLIRLKRDKKHKGPKVTTVVRTAMRTTPIPVTVGTFEAYHGGERWGGMPLGVGGGLGTQSAGPYMYIHIYIYGTPRTLYIHIYIYLCVQPLSLVLYVTSLLCSV